MILAASIGSTYAALLWLTAEYIARIRALILGTSPAVAIVFCGVSAALVEQRYPVLIAALYTATLVGTIICAVVDARTGFIFDVLTGLMFCVAVILSVGAGRAGQSAIGALVVGGAMFALYLVTGRRGFGLGDVKLAVVLGLGFGLERGAVAVGCAFILGAIYGIGLLALRRARRADAVRFGPFLAGGATLALAFDALRFGS